MSKELPPSRTADQFVVRFPDGMRDRIAASAKDAGRSMNAEIVARLQQSFEQPTDELPADVREGIEQLAERKKLTFDQALLAAVAMAHSPNAPAVIFVSITSGMRSQEVRQALGSFLDGVPDDAAITFQQG